MSIVFKKDKGCPLVVIWAYRSFQRILGLVRNCKTFLWEAKISTLAQTVSYSHILRLLWFLIFNKSQLNLQIPLKLVRAQTFEVNQKSTSLWNITVIQPFLDTFNPMYCNIRNLNPQPNTSNSSKGLAWPNSAPIVFLTFYRNSLSLIFISVYGYMS